MSKLMKRLLILYRSSRIQWVGFS